MAWARGEPGRVRFNCRGRYVAPKLAGLCTGQQAANQLQAVEVAQVHEEERP